ncbi:recombinase family protein [Streptomyces sp. DW26H14]|uniref:recombinase family protein n=1 Tax=Streptomyces sp. DW26H14 TaxID=3435395 RepID=UPI00403D906F
MAEPVHGYMRAYRDTSDEEVEAVQEQMRAFASARGWELVEIHEETTEGSLAVLGELTEGLRNSGARLVLVPSYRHLGANLVLQAHVVNHLLDAAGAEVRSAGVVR